MSMCLLLCIALMISLQVNAFVVSGVEIFGISDNRIKRQILHNVADDIKQKYEKLYNANPADSDIQATLLNVYLWHRAMCLYIKRSHHFAFVDIIPILYPELNQVVVTIEIVASDDKDRLYHLFPLIDISASEKPALELTQGMQSFSIFSKWDDYLSIGQDLAVNRALGDISHDCQYLHCLFGYRHEKLANFEQYWHLLAAAERATLRHFAQRQQAVSYRLATVYILGHQTNCDSLFSDIRSALRDNAVSVRNAALRVVASALLKCEAPRALPWEEIISALKYPSVMTRNKALVIIDELLQDPLMGKQLSPRIWHFIKAAAGSIQPNTGVYAKRILQRYGVLL